MTTQRKISHEEARESWRRFENAFWRREPGPRVGIPARPDHDDDLILEAFFEQQATPNPATIQDIKNRIDTRLNDYLCEMKPGYDDSIVGFNEAWDIVRKVFDDIAGHPR